MKIVHFFFIPYLRASCNLDAIQDFYLIFVKLFYILPRGLTESLNNLINVYTSAAPGQTECDNAIRAIQSSRHVLENSNQSISDSSYFECLDTVMEKSKSLGDGMTGIANHAKHSEHDLFGDAVKGVAEAICGLVEAAAQAAYLVGMVTHEISPITIFGHKPFWQKFHQKFNIFHAKISTSSDFGSYLV